MYIQEFNDKTNMITLLVNCCCMRISLLCRWLGHSFSACIVYLTYPKAGNFLLIILYTVLALNS